MKHFISKGILPNHHENTASRKMLIKIDPNQQRREALTFILNYAQQNALQLPGRYVLSDGQFADLYLLPNQANCTRRDIYERYDQACSEIHCEAISFSLFSELWECQYPNVLTLNDRSELCFECRRYQQIMFSASSSEKVLNGNESAKIEATQRYLEHLNFVRDETKHYHALIDQCRLNYEECMLKNTGDLESTIRHSIVPSIGSMHYTFDWYSTISLPYVDTVKHRNSSILFKSCYKVALFGVSIEPIRKFVLYIVPEFVCHLRETLPSITVSSSIIPHHHICSHFFKTFQFNEKETYLHFANNSINQAKNGLLFSYFMWRSLVGMV